MSGEKGEPLSTPTAMTCQGPSVDQRAMEYHWTCAKCGYAKNKVDNFMPRRVRQCDNCCDEHWIEFKR